MNQLLASEEYLLAFERYVRYGDTEKLNKLTEYSANGYPLPKKWADFLKEILEKDKIQQVVYSDYKAISYIESVDRATEAVKKINTPFYSKECHVYCFSSTELEFLNELNCVLYKFETEQIIYPPNSGIESCKPAVIGLPNHPMFLRIIQHVQRFKSKIPVKVIPSSSDVLSSNSKIVNYSYPSITADHSSRSSVTLYVYTFIINPEKYFVNSHKNNKETYNSVSKLLGLEFRL